MEKQIKSFLIETANEVTLKLYINDNCIDGIMVSKLASSAVGGGFKCQSDKTKD
jgi:hypothetical protein